MKLIIKNSNNEYIREFSKEELYNQNYIADELRFFQGSLTANIFVSNEKIDSGELANLKFYLKKINICFIKLYSSSREVIISGKSLGIDSSFVKEKELHKKSLLKKNKHPDIFHKGTIRSGERISSNGHLFIIGDVNPGAIVSAKQNVYVWGKLLGVAFAGESGNKNASISSLYLNPLQLRIAGTIAIGPQEKPKYHHPEIAVLNNESIIIKPYIIET